MEKNVGVGLIISVLVRTREGLYRWGKADKRTRKDLERYFPLGKEGDYKISLSLSLSSLNDDGCAVASRHVTTRTAHAQHSFFTPFILSLSLFVFFFSIRLFIFVSRHSDVINRASVLSRDTFVC